MEENKHITLVGKFLDFLKEIEGDIQKNTVPICFHCGAAYIRDEKFCGRHYTTWKPGCNCLNKPTIRITTGYRENDTENNTTNI